ncbi:MAG: hypothetical protein JJT99_04670 [Rhodobacteraceae bacterium]|nr:hypothetical protein [Paracoccaceae bacterium]
MKPSAASLALLCLILPMQTTAQGVADSEFLRFVFSDAPAQFQPVPGRAGMTRFSMLDAISIEGQAGAARLVVKFALPPEAGIDAQPIDARVSYRPDGYVNYWQTAKLPAPGSFIFEQVQLSGPRPRIAGHFEVTLCARASVIAAHDTGNCRVATGSFATKLQID